MLRNVICLWSGNTFSADFSIIVTCSKKLMKKLILINNIIYTRNYIDTDAFRNIVDEDTYFAFSKGLASRGDTRDYKQLDTEIGATRLNRYFFGVITELLMCANRSKSKGFNLRFKLSHTAFHFRSYRLRDIVEKRFKNNHVSNFVILILEAVRSVFPIGKTLRHLSIMLLSKLGLTNFFLLLYTRLIPLNKDIASLVDEVQPDLVLIPSGGLDVIANDFFCLSLRKGSFKTVLMIDNWDNLCSKSTFPVNPDYITVWGEQSAGFARNLHHIDESKIFLAGTPRFDVYYKFKSDKERGGVKESPLDAPYILFAGCWPPFDEIGVLEKLDLLVDKYKDVLPKGCKILYRPHPWGESYDKLDFLISKGLSNIRIDPQILESRRPDDWTKRTNYQPKLDYYPSLLDGCEYVICPLSSITIEASIMNKKVLVLAHDDGKNLLNPAFMYENSDYFDRFSDMDNLVLLDDGSKLDELFYKISTSDLYVPEKALSYYIVNDAQYYPDRIENIINKIENEISV